MHLYFARRVPTEARAILHQHDLRSISRGGDRGTYTGKPASGNEDIGLKIHDSHVRLGCERRSGWMRRSDLFELPANSVGNGRWSV